MSYKHAAGKEMLLAKAVKRPPSAKKVTKPSARPSTAVRQVLKQTSVAPDAADQEGLQHGEMVELCDAMQYS